MPGAGGGALHTVGAAAAVHFRHAAGVYMDCVKLTDPHTGPQAKTAEGTVQRTVAGDLRGGGTILQTNVPAEFPACPVASGAADKGNPAFRRRDLHAHQRGNAAGLLAGTAGTGVYRGFPGQNSRRASSASGIAASAAVRARKTLPNQGKAGVLFHLEHPGGARQQQSEHPAKDAQSQNRVENVHFYLLTTESEALRSP